MGKVNSERSKRVGSTSERLKKLPYEKRVCRIEHYPKSIGGDIGDSVEDRVFTKPPTMEQEIDAIADAGTEVWSINASRGRGIPLWPSKMLDTPADADPDRISKFLDLAHRKDIIVLTYYPFIFTKLLSKIHPEWMIQMLDDGGEEVWNEGWFCWNSPYRDWLPEYLNEMLDYFDFDGIYFDDMNWGSHSDTGQRRTGGCHCQYCRKMYFRETGKELSSKVQMDSIDFRQYINWRYGKFKDAVEHVAKGVYSKHPDAIIDWNYYGRPYGPDDIGWKSAHPLNPLDHSTYFFMEAGWDNLGASFPAKLLRAADSTFGLWISATQISRECMNPYSAPYPEPYTTTACGLSAVVRGGGSVVRCLGAGEDTIYGDTLKSVFTELKRLRPFVGGDSVKYLALHVSQQNRDFGYIETADDFWRLMRGSHEMLNRSQVLTEIVFDEQLTFKNLSHYKVLFMSNSKCLSGEQIAAIKRFVSEGGTLIATHETSLYDELGRKHDNFGLADVFGVEYQGLFQTSQNSYGTTGDPKVNPDHSNIYIPQKESLRNEFGQIVSFGAALSRISLRPGNETEIIFTKSNLKWKGKHHPVDNFYPGADSGEPAVTVNTFGKGKAIYICGDVGEGYDSAPLPQVKRFIAYLVLSARPPIEVEAPRVIDISAFMRMPGEMMIHLLNNQLPYIPWDTDSVDLRKYFYIDELLPVHDVVIKLNGVKVKNASLPFQNKRLDIDRDHDTITVPLVNIQEVVLLDIDD